MNKKNLKRSLVLGALMTFVIMGNAFAEDVTQSICSERITTGSGSFENTVYTGINTTSTNTGGVMNVSGKATFDNCDFIGNKLVYSSSTAHGGVFYVSGSGNLIITDSTIKNNYVESKSSRAYGAVIANSGKVTIKDSYIDTNLAKGSSQPYGVVINCNGAGSETNISNTTFTNSYSFKDDSGNNYTTNGKDVIYMNGGTLNLENVKFSGYGISNFINGQENSGASMNKINISGTENSFGSAMGRGIWNRGILTFEEGSYTKFSGGTEIENKNSYDGGAVVNLEKDAVVDMKNGISGSGTVNFNGGTLNGKITGTNTVNLNSGTWNLSGKSTVSDATFKAGSVLNITNGNSFTGSTYALNASGNAQTLKIEEGAKLQIGGIEFATYNIAKGFNEIVDEADEVITDGGYWDISLNNLMKGEWVTENGLQLKVVTKDADVLATEMGISEVTAKTLSDIVMAANESGVKEDIGTPKGKVVALANAIADSGGSKEAGQAVEAVQKMAEAGGNSATAAKVVTNVTGVTNQRLSFSGGNAGGNKGGHGVGLLEEGSGAAIWAQYVHGKDSVEDMPSTAGASSYEGQYNGIVMGVDFKKVGKFQSGIAFNYGEGDTNSVNTTSPTRSDYDFWGVGYYGNIRNADSNVIFDIGYAQTDSDVTSDVLGQSFEASPETTTWTAGVKVEKLYQNNNVQIVPYTGLRYMSIDADDYTTKCGATSYNMQRQDIWMLPVGVSIKQEIVNKNGWVVTPKVDLSYIWAFGDTDSEMEFATAFDSKTNIGYDVMDDGSWMGLVGVEAAMDDWTFGVSYSYQKGDHSESKKWYVDAKYSF